MYNRRHFISTFAAATALGSMPALAHKAYVVPPEHMPRIVKLNVDLPPNGIYVEPDDFALYLTMPKRKAIRYTVGIGRGDLYHSGVYTVGERRMWPTWTPSPQMIKRNPRYEKFADGVPGGPTNPLGIMALYLFDADGHDTMLRIHGTPDPWTVGQAVSNGCARLVQSHALHLYKQVPLATKVVLHEKGRTVEGEIADLAAIPKYSTHA